MHQASIKRSDSIQKQRGQANALIQLTWPLKNYD